MRPCMQEEFRLNEISRRITGAAIAVHHALGPGMLESAYEACLAHELLECELAFERQKPLPLVYRGQRLDAATGST
jgi:GxxExxY protein